MYCPTHYRLSISWNFAIVSSCLRNPLAQPFKKKEEKKNTKYREAKQNDWYLHRTPAIQIKICLFRNIYIIYVYTGNSVLLGNANLGIMLYTILTRP